MISLFITPPAVAGDLPQWATENLDAEQQAWIQARPLVRARVGDVRPEHFSENGEIKGLSLEYLQIISEKTGLKFDYVTGIPWAGAIENISQGKDADLLVTIKRTRERAALLAFTDDYLLRPWVIFTRTDAPFLSHIDELKGKLVVVENAYATHNKLEREYPDIRVKVVATTLDALRSLAAGRVDAYIGNLVTGTYLISVEGLANIKVAAPIHFDNHNLAMAVRNDWAILADIINKVLHEITPAQRQAINSHWLSVRFEHGIRWRDILMWAGLALTVFFVIVIIITMKNRQLRAEVAQRKQAVEVLRRSERRFHAAFDQQFQFMAILAPNGRVLEVNELALKSQDYSREDYIGKLFWESPAWHDLPEWSATWQERLKQAAQDKTPILTEDVYQTASGEIRFADAATTAVFNSDGAVEYFVVQAIDTTGRKRAQDERARLNRELSQVRKMEALGQLTGGVAHDFNNILAIMLGYNTLCMDLSRKIGQHKITEYLVKVEQAGLRAKDLVTQMLAFSRKDENKPLPLQIVPLVEGELTMLRSSLPSSIRIETQLQEGLPDVEFDPVHLQQILMNLSVNAGDAMAGSGTLTIGVKLVQSVGEECVACHKQIDGAWVELSVADTGPGIDADAMEHLFEPFFTTKPMGKGSGMGLAVVHGIITRLKGHIIVESESGKGCRMRLLFPPLSPSKTVPAKSDVLPAQTMQGSGQHILVVDDEAALADYLGELLELHSYRASVTSDSQAALDQLKENPQAVDLLVTDQTMPKMSGVELIMQARKLRPDMPAVLCTGFSEEINQQQAQEMGIHYLQKPVTGEVLLSTVHKALSGKH